MNCTSMLGYYTVSVETLDVVLGVNLNLLLLYLIKRYSNAYLGNYKYLLAVFACYDVYLCMLHALLNPVVTVVKNTVGATLYTPLQSQHMTCLFYSCFTVPFSLMNVHFLYRYWSVSNPNRLALFSRKWFVVVISLYPISAGAIWYYLAAVISTNSDDFTLDYVKERFYQTHSHRVDYGWIVMDHWRNDKLNVRVLYVIIACLLIIIGSLTLATTLAILTYKEILKTTTLSNKHRTMQYALLIAVCAQTLVPLICVYIPYFFCVLCPFLSISSGFGFIMANHYSLFVSIFPGWDALVIIILIRDYRMGLLRMFGLRRRKRIDVRKSQFTTALSLT